MANQPTKYKKFVATAATATLVASAIVPVASAASFTDVNADQAVHIDALVEQGIIKGYEDGTFKPNQSVTRGQVVKMLGKWVEAQGFAVPADWETTARFTDLAVTAKDKELLKYAAVVADAEVFNGSNGVLNAGGKITRENMALVLDRAYKAVYGTSLVEAAAGTQDITVSDLALAKAEAREAIQAIRNLGISTVANFNPKGDVTRANFAKFLNVAIETAEEGGITTPETGEVAISSLKASKVNELTVEFNKAVADTAAAAFAVKQGTTTDIKVSDIDWNEDKTVATLTVDHKFVAATYNLTVTGVAEEALTASVTTTREVASEIKFNSNKLVLTGSNTADGKLKEARITFDVYNQYGEEITDSIPKSYYSDLKVRGIKTDRDKDAISDTTKGLIQVWVDKDEDEGETGTISFTYEYGDIEIDVDQDVTLSDDLEPGEVKVEGVYNESGYELTAANVEKYSKDAKKAKDPNSTDGEDFYVLLSVKDQFGNPINAKDANNKKKAATSTTDAGKVIFESVKSNLRTSVSNKNIFELDEKNLDVVNVDGKYYFAIPMEFDIDRRTLYMDQTGENTVTIRSKSTGDVAESKITVADSSKIYSIGLSAPEEVVASDEKVKLPVEVLDQSGNKIVDVAKLNQAITDKQIKIDLEDSATTNPTFIFENNAVFLEFQSLKHSEAKKSVDMDIEVEVVDSKQEAELTLKVQPAAYATTLVKVADKFSTTRYQGEKFDLKLENLVIEDQYGRVIDKTTIPFSIVAEKTNSGSINLVDADDKPLAKQEATITNTAGKYTFVADKSITGTSVYEFTLKSKDNEKKDITSKVTVTFRSVDDTNAFASYKVKGETLGYFGDQTTADTVDIKVYGVTDTGREVELTKDAYQVLTNKYFKANNEPLVEWDKQKAKVGINKAEAEAKLKEDDLLNSFKTGLQVVINRTGETLTHEVTLTKLDREFAVLTLEDNASLAGKDLTELKYTTGDTVTVTSTNLFGVLLNSAVITVADQYGLELEADIKATKAEALKELQAVKDLHAAGEFKYTISNVNSTNDKYKVNRNGTQGAEITGVSAGDTFDLTIKIDGATKKLKVRLTK